MKGTQKKKRLLIGNFIIKASVKINNKLGGRHPEGRITDPRDTRMEETSRRRRKKEASSEGGQGPQEGVVPQMDGWKCVP